MHITTLTPPSGEPLSLADAKAFARVGSDHDDALMGQLIAAARAHVETETGLALVTQSLRLTLQDWPIGVLEQGVMRLPRRPAQGLTAVRLTDGVEATLITDQFQLTPGLSPQLKPQSGLAWPWPHSVHQWIEIDWVAGFGAAETVPEDLVHAVKRIVAFGVEHQGSRDWRAHEALTTELDEWLQPWREVRI